MFLKENSGFTYLEILLGIAILSIALLPILNYFVNSLSTVEQTTTNNQALDLIRSSIEIVKARSKMDWEYLKKIESSTILSEAAGTGNLSLKKFTLQVQLLNSVDLDNDGITDLKFLAVKLFQDDINKIYIETLISRR